MSHQFDYSLVLSKIYVPEKGLLAGILELAVRDLGSSIGNWSLRKDAFTWILSKKKSSKLYFTFQTVVSCLDLTEEQIDYILDKAIKSKEEYILHRDTTFSKIRDRNGRTETQEETQERCERESERGEGRKRICDSPCGPRYVVCQKVLSI